MRLPNSEHTSRPWRIHELTRDFRLEDVWAVPRSGGLDDFARLVCRIASFDPARSASGPMRALFALRWRIGDLLGWDAPTGTRQASRTTLRDRLPSDLRGGPAQGRGGRRFNPLYLLDDEYAAEIVNRTGHAVLHVGRVPMPDGGYRAQLAVHVRPNGLLGAGYLAVIKPVRRLVVYPLLARELATPTPA